MMTMLEYYFCKFIGKIKREKNKETLNKWFVKKGVHLPPKGGNVHINCNIAKNEPHLITIGYNTTIAGGVELVTHDNSISKVLPDTTDLFGKIIIGNNCFIGARSVIMYGVTIPDNVIVASGSVVTKSIMESNVVVGGNPAEVISTWDRFGDKSRPYVWNLKKTSREEMIKRTSNGEKLIKR